MTMPLVSIIIPCYNVAGFMKKCLDTVCAQTLRDIEIICINDGSTDGTPDILREYEAADERIRLINQPNAGVAAARNAGLDAACGKYIGFADPDDYVSPVMFQRLFFMIIRHISAIPKGTAASVRNGRGDSCKKRAWRASREADT